MGRYASHFQETLYREGRLIGFNAGFGAYSEHEHGYKGVEQIKPKKPIDKDKDNPFDGEIVEMPELVNLMEFSDGNVWMTNDGFTYSTLMQKTEEERRKVMEGYINNPDRERLEKFSREMGNNMTSPEVVALWNASYFSLISTNAQSSELIRRLYAEIQRGNIAISGDYSFLFKSRGLSFVLLDELSKDDLLAKKLVDYGKEMSVQFQREYNEFLKQEGLEGLFGGHKYPIEFWNVQTHAIREDYKGELMPEFYLELVDTSKGRENLNELSMHNVPHHMTGSEIKALVPIVQSQKYAEYARSHTKEEVELYLIEELALIREREGIEAGRYLADKEALGAIAEEQRTGTIEKVAKNLKGQIDKWLHPDRENDKEAETDGKGE